MGKLIIITAPSGAGKTSIIKRLLKRYSKLMFSISACTRLARQGETDGRDYYFLSEANFKEKIDSNEFIEWEMVYTGKYYGTLNSELERIWQNNKTPLIDIDVKGALNIKNKFGDSALSLFVKAPSVKTLRERLLNRGTENAESLKERINKATEELTYEPKFDFIVINNNLEEAVTEAIQIIDNFLNK